MREILFRGRAYDGKMVLGDLIHRAKVEYIRDTHLGTQYQVDPKTVGQYTGMVDKEGKRIFEGDVLEYPPFQIDEERFPATMHQVIWGDGGWKLREKGYPGDPYPLDSDTARDGKILGNIWDNPELMEVKADADPD